MQIKVYISTFDYSTDGDTCWVSGLKWANHAIEGERRYTATVDVPDRAEDLGEFTAAEAVQGGDDG